MKTQLTTLPSGLRIATCEMPQAETAAVGIWAGVGGRHEPAKLNGISHFIEHMLFKGTAKRSARRIMEEVEGVGGDMNAFTSEERTCYYAAAAYEFFPRLCNVLSDLYLNPRFAPQDIERERGVIGEEIMMYKDEPSSHVHEMLNSEAWPNHALGRSLTGTLSTIESFRREDFLDYRTRSYHAGSTVVSAAGKISHEEVVDRVGGLLAALPKGRKVRFTPAPLHSTKPRVVVEKRDTQQTQLAMGLPAASHHDARRYALQIMHVVLGGNASSRLFQQLREKRGLCYSVSTHPSCFEDTGILNVSLGLEQRNVEKSIQLILAAFEELKAKGVPPAELKRAKEYAVGTSRMSLERASNQNMRMGGSVLVHGKIVDPEHIHAKLRAVTSDDVQRVACDFLNPGRATVAVIGPAPDAKTIERLLGA
ncbi:pitrilysin family protein [soil metagenome]